MSSVLLARYMYYFDSIRSVSHSYAIQSNDKAHFVLFHCALATTTSTKGNCITFLLIANYLFDVYICVSVCMRTVNWFVLFPNTKPFIIRLSTSKNANYFLVFYSSMIHRHQPTKQDVSIFISIQFRCGFCHGNAIH